MSITDKSIGASQLLGGCPPPEVYAYEYALCMQQWFTVYKICDNTYEQ